MRFFGSRSIDLRGQSLGLGRTDWDQGFCHMVSQVDVNVTSDNLGWYGTFLFIWIVIIIIVVDLLGRLIRFDNRNTTSCFTHTLKPILNGTEHIVNILITLLNDLLHLTSGFGSLFFIVFHRFLQLDLVALIQEIISIITVLLHRFLFFLLLIILSRLDWLFLYLLLHIWHIINNFLYLLFQVIFRFRYIFWDIHSLLHI